jgi:uncharacterized membrane protein
MIDDEMMQRAQAVEAAGKAKFGESWSKFIAALGNRGIRQDQLVGVIQQQNGADLIAAAGREALIDAADDSHEANTVYSEIRDEERKKYRRSKGRS